MQKYLESSIKSLLGIEPGSKMELIIDTSSQVAPYIGKVITAYKINRLEKRLKKHQGKLEEIEGLLVSKEDEFLHIVQEKYFPFILEDLLNEDQDEKVSIILDGFVTVIENDYKDEGKFISFYDALRQVRANELKRLIEHTHEYIFLKNRLISEGKLSEKPRYRFTEEEEKEYNEKLSYQAHLDNRLMRLGLLSDKQEDFLDIIERILDYDKHKRESYMPDIDRHHIESKISWTKELNHLTGFGHSFVEFFGLDKNIQIHND